MSTGPACRVTVSARSPGRELNDALRCVLCALHPGGDARPGSRRARARDLQGSSASTSFAALPWNLHMGQKNTFFFLNHKYCLALEFETENSSVLGI